MRPALATLVALAGCTTFYGVEPSGGTTSSGGAGGGGEGGGIAAQNGFLSRFDAAHTCSVLVGCPSVARDLADSIGVPALPLREGNVKTSYSACVDWLSQPLRRAHPRFDDAQRIVACLAIASTCEGAHACTAVERLDGDDPRCAAMAPASCDGETWVDCPTGRAFHCDTSPFGEGASCYDGGGEVACGVGLAAAAEASCSGSILFLAAAAGEPRRAFDCASIGLACDGATCVGSAGVATCAPPDDGAGLTADDVACSPDRTHTRVCTVHGYRAEIDCGAEGGTCVEVGGDGVRCAAAGAACDPLAADVDVCSGTALRMCLGGKIVDFDCASIGAPCLGPQGPLSGRCGIP